jgi:predicted flap endonuclease-1-like 5' DNA nuclease
MPNRELEGLYAEFHLHPVLQPAESHKEGRPIYKDELYIQIQIKGQKNQIRDRRATKQDEMDFPTAWERWSSKNESLHTGTPVSAIPGIGPSMALELKGLGITTVEDFAALTDAGCMNIRGGYDFRQRAIAYLKSASIKINTKEDIKTEAPVDVELMKRDPNVIPVEKRRRN